MKNKQQMCVLSFPKTDTTATSPDPHPLETGEGEEKNTVSSLSHPLILLMFFDSTGGFIRTNWQYSNENKIKQRINHVG